MLNPEFDLLLTALLDGELEPEPRLRVESAVRGDPAAGDRLAVLTRVRDLVASLPPPELAPDVSGEVVAILASRRRASFRTARFAAAIVSGLAAAAALMIFFGKPPIAPGGGNEMARADKRIKSFRTPPTPLLANRSRPGRPMPIPPTLDVSIREDVLAAEVRERDDRAGLDGLLRQDGVQVIDLLVDEVGPASLDALDEVVRSTSRVKPHHARVHVMQSIENDPARPGRTCAYVLVMDEHEYAKFRRKLDDRFPESASAPAPIPRDALDSLSKVARVEFFRDVPPAGTLKQPPADLFPEVAIRAPRREGHNEILIGPGGATVRQGEPSPRANAPDRKPQVAANLDAKPKESPAVVYVIRVSPRQRLRG